MPSRPPEQSAGLGITPGSSIDAVELSTFSPGAHTGGPKGKGREVEGAETTEDDAADGSDAEVEGLLRPGSKVEPEDSSMKQESGPGRSSAGGGSGRQPKTWWGRTFGSMSRTQRRLFFRELATQVLPILLLALVGAVITGMLLDKLQGWRVFIRIEELFILIPILLNLKGNLEMNLAARFSTSANIGELDLRRTRRSLILGNLALLQVQALIVSLISGLLSFLLGLLSRRGVHHHLQHPGYKPGSAQALDDSLRGSYFEALLVLCVSMLAASLSSGVLGSFMCSLVVICRRFKINPDNIATPIASALGDMVTLVILGVLSSLFMLFEGTLVSTAVFLCLLAAVAVNVVITFRNAYVQELLTIGWGPLFLAMGISSGSGLVLEAYVTKFDGFALMAPVVMAISGAAGSIYVSRLSTSLHSSSKEHYLIVALCLFALTCPVLYLFLALVWITGQAPVTFLFAMGFLVAVAVQVAISIILAYHLTFILWKLDYDPDVYCLPLLSSFLDVTGQLLLVGAFALGSPPATPVVGTGIDGSAGETVASLAARLVTRWRG